MQDAQIRNHLSGETIADFYRNARGTPEKMLQFQAMRRCVLNDPKMMAKVSAAREKDFVIMYSDYLCLKYNSLDAFLSHFVAKLHEAQRAMDATPLNKEIKAYFHALSIILI